MTFWPIQICQDIVSQKKKCPIFMESTCSKWLTHRKKYCYTWHMRYLPMDHRWRMNKRAFNNTQELDGTLVVPNSKDIIRKLDVLFECGDNDARREKRQKTTQDIVDTSVDVGWKKKSIFFTLPYWKDNLL
jgi:murein L,D-transpeptidase YafK